MPDLKYKSPNIFEIKDIETHITVMPAFYAEVLFSQEMITREEYDALHDGKVLKIVKPEMLFPYFVISKPVQTSC